MVDPDRSLLALSAPECLQLLHSRQVGRVVFTERALPAVTPVSYAVLDQAVVFATSSSSRLARAAASSVLAFQVDDLDPTTRTGWSVVVTGLPEQVTEPREQSRVRSVLDTWAPGTHDLLLRLPLTIVTGRRIADEASRPAR